MSDNIPLLLNAGFEQGGGWTGGVGWGSCTVGRATGTTPEGGFATGDPLHFAVVHDRKTPSSAPVFSGSTPDSTTVPAGLDAYLTDDHILCWMSAAFVNHMPQGGLYEMLAENGGGTALKRMEIYATSMACGVNGGMMYLLASVPGTGMVGTEMLGFNGISSTSGANPVLSYGGPPVNLLCDLVQSPNGNYTPLELT